MKRKTKQYDSRTESQKDSMTLSEKIMAEWDFSKNINLSPEVLTLRSSENVWWRCGKGHSWQARISDRNVGKGCPYCSGRNLILNKTDLATMNSDLAHEWDWKRNGVLKPDMVSEHSNRKVWWVCKRGHSWIASVNQRSGGSGCPICSGRKVCVGYNDLATKKPHLAVEWDFERNTPLAPEHVTAGCNKKVWWKCIRGHSWEAQINHRSNGASCPFCAGQRVMEGETDLLTKNPQLAQEWDADKNGTLLPNQVSDNSGKKVWWKCSKGHSWKAEVRNRNYGGGCPFCSGRNAIVGENDLQTVAPQIAMQWDYERNGITPSQVKLNSNIAVWWKCPQGHSWKARIYSRKNGVGCPYCAGKKPILGVNDLVTLSPWFIEEWDYEKNRLVEPSMMMIKSGKKVWWKCEMGHLWKTSIRSRSRGSKCPVCNK